MNPEQRIQKALFDWWELAAQSYNLDPRVMSHCPNGGKRRPIEGAIFKGLGVRAGFEDVLLLVPRGDKHALLIELKSADGRISVEQREMMKLHQDLNYCSIVCWSTTEAISAIVNYLREGEPFIRKNE